MNRLRDVRQSKGMTQKQVADHIGVAQNTYSYWESERSKIDSLSLKRLSELFGVSTDYLLGREESQIDLHKGVAIKMIPVLGSVKAGLNGVAREEAGTHYPAPAHMAPDGEKYFFLVVEGNSMSPEINQGDMILVKRQNSIDSGTLGVFLIDGEEGVIKRVRYDTDYIELISTNQEYPIRRFENAEVLRVFVVGLVVGCFKTY